MAKPLVSSPMPRAVQLMLCTLVPAPFDDPDWIFEPKLDGLRVLCRFDGKRVTLRSRNDKSQDFQFPDVVEALRKGLSRPALLDGEIVCLDERGQSSFRALQQRFHLTDAGVVAERVKQYPAYLHVFDLLYYDRYDARPLPLRERKRLLKKAVKWSSRIRWTPITPGKGIAMLRETCRERGEGIVGEGHGASDVFDRAFVKGGFEALAVERADGVKGAGAFVAQDAGDQAFSVESHGGVG